MNLLFALSIVAASFFLDMPQMECEIHDLLRRFDPFGTLSTTLRSLMKAQTISEKWQEEKQGSLPWLGTAASSEPLF